MSRIGNKIIVLPSTVTIDRDGQVLTVKGPKGTSTLTLPSGISYKLEDGNITISRADDSKRNKELHGTARANLNNIIVGVSEGFTKQLELVGIGYRSAMRGNDIVLTVGYSHEVVITPEPGSSISVQTPTEITVTGISRQAVGQTAARIREVRPPEPYNGKGIKYKGEHIIRKEGKRAGKK